jgi:hypothetical protein
MGSKIRVRLVSKWHIQKIQCRDAQRANDKCKFRVCIVWSGGGGDIHEQ